MSAAHIAARTESAPPAFGVLLRAGLLGGVAGGVAGALVSWLLVEIPIRAALEIEAAGEAAGDGHGHEEMFGRGTQVIGGMLGAVLAGVVLGLVFAVVFARLRPNLAGRTDFGRALGLALAGFVVLSVLPAIKYPANPPAVGDPDTIETRTLYYLTFLAAAVLVASALFVIRRRLPAQWPQSWSTSVTLVLGVAAFAVLVAVWPASPDTIPADVPAALIWQFRLSSLAELGAVWITLGLVAGLLIERRTAVPG